MKQIRKLSLLIAGGMLLVSPALAWEVPGCRQAWNALGSRGALQNVAVLINKDCPVMYRKGWVLNRAGPDDGKEVPGCRTAWTALAAKDALGPGKFLVTHNCPLIYRKGWR